jgi:hypothetical protein
MRTIDTPLCNIPIFAAAPRDKSKILCSLLFGPLSLTLTTTHLPFLILVTRSHVLNGKCHVAHVKPFGFQRSPLAVLFPPVSCPYQLAIPVSAFACPAIKANRTTRISSVFIALTYSCEWRTCYRGRVSPLGQNFCEPIFR